MGLEAFKALFGFNWMVILVSIVVALVAVKFLWELIEWFLKKLKIETGSMKERRKINEWLSTNSQQLKELSKVTERQGREFKEDHELLVKTVQDLKRLEERDEQEVIDFKNHLVHEKGQNIKIQQELTDAINSINERIGVLRKESVEREVSDIRWEILKFGTDVSNGKIATRESYDYILKQYDRYEELLKELGQENGLINETVKFLKIKYQERLKQGIKRDIEGGDTK